MYDKINSRLPIILFDYKKRLVFPAHEKYDIFNCLPASFRERDLFIKHFLDKGKKQATFRQYKAIDPLFHGTAKYKKQYANIELTEWQYVRLLQINANDLNDALNELIELSYIGEKRKNTQITAERLAAKCVDEVFKGVSENLSKLLRLSDDEY